MKFLQSNNTYSLFMIHVIKYYTGQSFHFQCVHTFCSYKGMAEINILNQY